ncbi:hypothetical protein GUY44_06965 [Pimelobacter simplex]|uniref:Phage protein n=1 Tax=Nocardioides simplex TaxID=2045 RepID=A0A0A1DM84_NOCSI|nr:hypothetical protein [Pimelobacter simplex]AIY17752.1 Phage protein [Pimelobacter simplex]MCG8150212.1 hypothetical protein [Pimelobacter simplex]GEB13578.1 hypothetical protein NSI01_18930 [Pimelobacter simplex]SFM71447.1 hypothetical protein SAMN05421671_3093 [Pimelobacter simplex]
MPILDIQKRARELGRIRLGQKQAFTRRDGSEGVKPVKLDRFRLTSASKPLLEKVAELYGGDVAEWTPPGGSPQWEVVTASARLPIMVPPQPVTQWYETWSRAGCQHRCDGQHNVLTDEPCDPDDPQHIEALKKPTTRLNVVLRDVEGIGVWRVETHGWNAALELPDVAEFLAQAGGYVNGWLALEQRTSVGRNESTGQPETRHYMVPIIEIDVTPAQLMAGHGRVAAPALAGGPVTSAPALAAAGPDYVALAAEATDAEEIRELWRQANAAGHMTQGLNEHLVRRAAELPDPAAAAAPAEQAVDEDGAVEGEVVGDDTPVADPGPDADAIWQRIVTEAGQQGMTLPDVQDHFAQVMGGLTCDSASAAELQHYLTQLQTGHAA